MQILAKYYWQPKDPLLYVWSFVRIVLETRATLKYKDPNDLSRIKET